MKATVAITKSKMQFNIDSCMKILWETKIKNRTDFRNAMTYIFNQPTFNAKDKLKTTQDTLMGLQLGMDYFNEAFVLDTHFFRSVQINVSNLLMH